MKLVKFKSRPLNELFSISTIMTPQGDVRFCVDYRDTDNKSLNIVFKHLSSAIDFVSSNF